MLKSETRVMRRGVWAPLALMLWAAGAQAEEARPRMERTGEARTVFHGKGPAGFKLEGTTSDLKLTDDGKVLTITVPLAALDTGISLRNTHMREKYLQVDKHPNAELKVDWTKVKLPAEGATSEGQAVGTMALHGQSREVNFGYRIIRRGAEYEVTGNVPLNIKDFGIDIPNYLGVTVKPDITVDTSFKAKGT